MRTNILSLVFALVAIVSLQSAFATPTTNPDILARRGKALQGAGTEQPVLTVTAPTGGWTSSYMLEVAGSCSDKTVDPIIASINGVRYFIRSQEGEFSRKFPASRGQNSVTIECGNKAGLAKESRTITGVMSPVRLKIVLTSDTDGVYTDLHMYEPDGRHVYWANTESPSGGMFFLNSQGESFDQPGYGPYLYVHPSPPVGVFRIDTNYWPGGAVQHTLANLDVVTDEGLPSEGRRRVRKPLARPGETQTLAYLVVRANGLPMQIWVPGQDSIEDMPAEVKQYQREVEPKIKKGDEEYAYIPHVDETPLRRAIVTMALAQAKKVSMRWQPEQRDCAGLVRFAYREALAPRDDDQLRELPKAARNVPGLRFPAELFVHSYPKVWQTGYSTDGSAKYDYFADAETLLGFNFRLKSKSVDDAMPGDILAYKKDDAADSPYHLMMFAGPNARSGVVVYHTGTEFERLPRRAGYAPIKTPPSVRVVPISDLIASPDPVWFPVESNPHFLGVFEWNRFRPASEGKSHVLSS